MLSSFYICSLQNKTLIDMVRQEREEKKGMEQTRYLISDAAKKVEVESHVLRYWEEELEIPIKRNELGHRYYTQEDVDRFREIKNLKEQGLQLKAIRMILRDGKLERWDDKISAVVAGPFLGEKKEEKEEKEEKEAKEERMEENMVEVRTNGATVMANTASDGHIISEQERHMIEIIRKRERTQEREDERRKREEEHYKALDEMLRSYSSKKGKRAKEEKKKTIRFGMKKKPSII